MSAPFGALLALFFATPSPVDAPRKPAAPPPVFLTTCPGCRADGNFADPEQLDRFARTLATDPALAPSASPLYDRSGTSKWIAGAGGLIGAGVVAFALTHPLDECQFSSPTDQRCGTSINFPGIGAGAAVIGAGLLAGFVHYLWTRPSQGEVVDALNRWNDRHPDERYVLDAKTGELHPTR